MLVAIVARRRRCRSRASPAGAVRRSVAAVAALAVDRRRRHGPAPRTPAAAADRGAAGRRPARRDRSRPSAGDRARRAGRSRHGARRSPRGRRRRRRRPAERRRPGHRPRCRPGRRDPRRGPRGGRLLIDGGPDPDRLLVALDERIPPWDRRIDAVDPDAPPRGPRRRAGAAPGALPGRRVFEPGMRGPGPGLRGVARASCVERARRRGSGLAAGDRLRGRRRSTCASCGRSAAGSRSSRRTAAPGSTTCRSCCSGAVGGRRFLLMGDVEEGIDPSCSPAACRGSTCSRSPTTAAAPRRRRRSSTRSGRGSRSPRRAPATRTAIRRARRWNGCPRRAPASSGRIATGLWP